MIIAVASTRKPKVDAVRAVAARLRPFWGGEAAVEENEVESGVAETPRSVDDLISGARNRTRTLHRMYVAAGRSAGLYVGMEGGLFALTLADGSRNVFLQNWVCAFDGTRESLAAGGAIAVPERIATAVLDEGRSLADVIDHVADGTNIRSNQGTWGVLTRDLVTRQASFEQALINALAPWYNREFYQPGSMEKAV